MLECVPNVSEGRDRRVIERLADAIRGVAGVRLADVHADPDHHRSVFTFLGAPDAVEAAALALAEAVFSSIDMRGTEACTGASARSTWCRSCRCGSRHGRCGGACARVGEALGRTHGCPSTSMAPRPSRRSLAQVRAGEYEGLGPGSPTRGAPGRGPRASIRQGATAVGARDVLVAFNVARLAGPRRGARDRAGRPRVLGRPARAPGAGPAAGAPARGAGLDEPARLPRDVAGPRLRRGGGRGRAARDRRRASGAGGAGAAAAFDGRSPAAWDCPT